MRDRSIYLVLVDAIDLLSQPFTAVLLPPTVRDEISRTGTPRLDVRPAHWLQIVRSPAHETVPSPSRDIGQRAAVAPAMSQPAGVILMDDRRGVATAQANGLVSISTLGLPDQAFDFSAGRRAG